MIRDSLSEELNIMVDPAAVLKEYVARQPFPSHEIIIAEVGGWKNEYDILKSTPFQKRNYSLSNGMPDYIIYHHILQTISQ